MEVASSDKLPILSGLDVLSLISLNPRVVIRNREIVLDAPLILDTNSFAYFTTCFFHTSDKYDPTLEAPLVTLEGTGDKLILAQNYLVNPYGPVINEDVDLKLVTSNLFETGLPLDNDKRGWFGTNVRYTTNSPVPQEELDATMPEELKPCEIQDVAS